MVEFLAVCFTWVAKWYKGGKTSNSRRLGFLLSVLVSLVWMGYFIQHSQYWLSLNSAVAICLCVRGVRNNMENK